MSSRRYVLLFFLLIPPTHNAVADKGGAVCKDRKEQAARGLLPASERYFESWFGTAEKFPDLPKVTIYDGQPIRELLTPLKSMKLPREIQRDLNECLDLLDSKNLKAATVKFSASARLASYNPYYHFVELNSNWAQHVTPLHVLYAIRHELNHFKNNETFLKGEPLVVTPGMNRNDFVDANLKTLLRDEAICRDGDLEFLDAFKTSNKFRGFRDDILSRHTFAEALENDPAVAAAPDRESKITAIAEVLRREGGYETRLREQLGSLYDSATRNGSRAFARNLNNFPDLYNHAAWNFP